MTDHTPGPWEAVEHGGDYPYFQVLAGSWDVAHNRYSTRTVGVERANARLIAASPALLEAAQRVAAYLVAPDLGAAPEARASLTAAIALATGEEAS